jgi:hypothetical protein
MKKHDAKKRENFKQYYEYYEDDKKSLHTFLAMAYSIPFLIIAGNLLALIPDTLDKAYILSTYDLPLKYFLPEKSETMQYLVLSVLFPILFCFFYKIMSRLQGKSKRILSSWAPAMKPLEVLSILIVSVWSVYGNYKGVQGFDPATNRLYTFIMALIVILWAVLASGFCFYYEISSRFRRYLRYSALAIVIVSGLFVTWLYVTDHYYLNSYTLHHFDAYYYPVFEVFHGKTLLIDFSSLYGFYPYIMAFFLKITGGISMLRFSLLIAGIVLVNVVSVGLFLWLNVKNRLVALLGFMAVLFTSFLSSLIINNGYYLQYFPHRTLCPSLLLLICSLYIRSEAKISRGVITFFGYLLCVFSLLWNVDSGAVVVAGWCLFLLYGGMSRHTLRERAFYYESTGIIVRTVLSAMLSILIVFLVTFIRSGQLVGLSDMLSAQILFKGSGYYMLPMPSRFPWIVLAIVYMAGLAKSLGGLPLLEKNEKTEPDRMKAMVFILSILGVGMFSYYQGRSHKDVLVVVLWPAILLIILFADEYAGKIARQYRTYMETNILRKTKLAADAAKLFLTAGLLVTLSISFFLLDLKDNDLIYNINTTNAVNSQKDAMRYRFSFIARNITNREDIDILTLYFTEYYTQLDVENPMPVRSVVDWATKADYRKVVDYLRISDNKLFIDKKVVIMLSTYMPLEFTEVMNQRYTLVANYDTISYYKPNE